MITQFSIGASRTTNLGNFESLKVEASVTVNVPGDPQAGMQGVLDGTPVEMKYVPLSISDTLRQEAQKVLRQLMEDTYNEFKKKEKK